MFISVEKAVQLTGRSKNALYRQMSQGRLNYVLCTKGKRYVEVAELRRVYGELDGVLDEPVIDGGEALLAVITQMRDELNRLNDKIDRQAEQIEALGNGHVPTAAKPVQPALPESPEKDPEWPPFITCYADLAKRDEIKARYANK